MKNIEQLTGSQEVVGSNPIFSISSFGQVQHKSFDYNEREMIQSVSAEVDGEMFQPMGSNGSAAPMNYTHTFTYDGFNRLTEAVLSDYDFGNNTEAYHENKVQPIQFLGHVGCK